MEQLISRCLQNMTHITPTGTDISRTYYLLASLYQENGQKTRIRELITAASSLNTMMKASIVQKLESILASTSSQEQL